MFGGGDGEAGVGGGAAVIEELFEGAVCDLFGDPGVELGGPAESTGAFLSAMRTRLEIVDDAAGAGDQDVVVAEGAEGAAELEELLRG